MPETLYEGRFLRLVRDGHWEFAERTQASGAVAIIALTELRELLFVEQFRIPLQKHTIELPAGLAGDEEGGADEDFSAAARRELLEETGYDAERFENLGEGASSAGLTSETITLFRAHNVRKVQAGGGVGSENIRIHAVPLMQAAEWIAAQVTQGKAVDWKVYAGLFWALRA